MTEDSRIDPSRWAESAAARAAVPVGAPRIGVVVSLTYPGMTAAMADLLGGLTEVTFTGLREAGADPLLIDSSAGIEQARGAARLARLDGLLFLGGADVDPTLYGGDPDGPGLWGVDRRADEFCIALILRAVQTDHPVLAICRGAQLLNVATGGTLIGDLPPDGVHRGLPGGEVFVDEPVDILEGSLLAAALGQDRITVRSGHHQAVAELGADLRVAARASDGVIEGIEHTSAGWVVGTQWHPEEAHGNASDRALLFQALVARAARVRTAG